MRKPTRASALLLLLLAACGSGVEAGVNVKSVATDLVYGIPEEEVPAAPANIGTPPDDPVGVVFGGGPVDEDERNRGLPEPAAPECPAAPADKFPKEAAMSQVKGKPAEGQYMWRVDGTEDTALLGEIRLPRGVHRQIENVIDSEGGNFQYTTVERDLRFGSRTTIKTTYEVRADDGIYLIRIVRETEGGNEGTFQPTPAIEILPLPVELGAEVSSTGIDPNTLELLRVTGTVPKRQRIDACGEPLDSFLVDGIQEFVSASGEPNRRNYDYGVATQLGGMIIFEHVDAPCASGDGDACEPKPTLTFNAHLGQVTPTEVD